MFWGSRRCRGKPRMHRFYGSANIARRWNFGFSCYIFLLFGAIFDHLDHNWSKKQVHKKITYQSILIYIQWYLVWLQQWSRRERQFDWEGVSPHAWQRSLGSYSPYVFDWWKFNIFPLVYSKRLPKFSPQRNQQRPFTVLYQKRAVDTWLDYNLKVALLFLQNSIPLHFGLYAQGYKTSTLQKHVSIALFNFWWKSLGG